MNIYTAKEQINNFYHSHHVAFNIDLTTENITEHDVDVLFNIIKHAPEKTFHFTYVFNNQLSSPYFPSANYKRDGFSIGLQPTDLSEGCLTLDAWLQKIKMTWDEMAELFQDDRAFLGIDASIAPLFTGKSSLIDVIESFGVAFTASVITDLYVTITDFLQRHNPKPIGLCGLMFPCLEDFSLAAAYEQGHFSIERNIYLSLHSGLGIDTYPIGLDERPEHVLNILKLLQGLSNKYGKTLSARFVSDGHANIGDMTSFRNPYLKDVTIRPLVL